MKAPKVGFVSLGCPKALVDSERIITELRRTGYEVAGDYNRADLVVVNTCGFIDSAKQESLEAIGEAMRENGKVIVTGCMGSGADAEKIRTLHPSVLSVTGPARYEDVMNAVQQYLPYQKSHNPHQDLLPPQGIKLTPRHYAYLKISEGCNHRCSFCIIPSLRGDLSSRDIGSIMEEAERLVNAGVQELLIISQDTSAYGIDIKYKTGFWQGRPIKSRFFELCKALGDLGVWVRLHYVYPYPHVDDVIPLMAEGKILPYLDIPFQHASPAILRAMKRPAHAENVLERIRQWRAVCPDLALRSTFIVGFPGETEDDFSMLLDWLEQASIDRVGCFQYSPVEGAVANKLPGHVSDEIKQRRWEQLMEHQQRISAGRLQKRIGKTIEVLIDEVGTDGAIARSWADAPEIDGVVHIAGPVSVKPGQRISVTVTDADDYDLWAESLTVV